jgi:hypothetical protein
MWKRMRSTTKAVLFGAALALCLGLVQIGSAQMTHSESSKAGKTVYVCACKGDSSCPCMSMANKEGKCACGEHSPDMKAVPRNSAWAKHNRKALE